MYVALLSVLVGAFVLFSGGFGWSVRGSASRRWNGRRARGRASNFGVTTPTSTARTIACASVLHLTVCWPSPEPRSPKSASPTTLSRSRCGREHSAELSCGKRFGVLRSAGATMAPSRSRRPSAVAGLWIGESTARIAGSSPKSCLGSSRCAAHPRLRGHGAVAGPTHRPHLGGHPDALRVANRYRDHQPRRG